MEVRGRRAATAGQGGAALGVEMLNRITGQVVDRSVRIHQALGPGLLESVYARILARDMARHGYRVERQKPVSFEFDGLWFEHALRVDLVIERAVVVEVKSVESIAAVHRKQLMTYLRLLNCRVGLLVNFGAPVLKDGITRIVNGF